MFNAKRESEAYIAIVTALTPFMGDGQLSNAQLLGTLELFKSQLLDRVEWNPMEEEEEEEE